MSRLSSGDVAYISTRLHVESMTVSDDGKDCENDDNAIGTEEGLKASFSLISTGAES